MENIYMVKIDIYFGDKLIDYSFHGAFKSFRSASEWLVEEGFESFYDDELSELFEDEIISFVHVDKENKEERHANIESYFVQN